MSEIAFWQHDEKILAGLFQGISAAEGTEVILESTANGAQGEFYRLWKGACNGENEYMPIFLPWYITDEYRREAPEGMQLTIEEETLVEKYGLDNDQLYWRRLKIAEGGELKFQQEYPATADEAFIVSGSNVFNVERLDAYCQNHIKEDQSGTHTARCLTNIEKETSTYTTFLSGKSPML